jgi:transcriptional regulator with XRE-family HTH domain
MEQEKIGLFISELRKQKHMIQAELAERLDVSDKTISKWENGKSLPDISYLKDICLILDINVNELLAGEHLSPNDYSAKADNTILALMEENKKKSFKSLFALISAALLLLITIFIAFVPIQKSFSEMRAFINAFIDPPNLILLVILEFVAVIFSGKRRFIDVLAVLNSTLIPVGVVSASVGIITIFQYGNEEANILANAGISLLPILYSSLLKVIVVVFLKRRNSL